MIMTTRSFLCGILAAAGFGLLAACGGSDAVSPEPEGIAALRTAIAPYENLNTARSAGYNVALTDCMSNGAVGAMGIHYGKTSAFDGTLDPTSPEVVIYEPGPNATMQFVGVRVCDSVRGFCRRRPLAPTLFGVRFIPNDMFQLWTLHVWTERANPSGLFSEWNPAVHCPT
jgi:hypothetical protein